MFSISKMTRLACLSLLIVAFGSTGTISSSVFQSLQAFAETTSSNPYRGKFSAENASRIDAIVTRILLRGKTLPQENYLSYLALVDQGITSLSEQPNYRDNTEVKNVVGFISYEISNTRKGLSDGTLIADDVIRIAEEAYNASVAVKTPASSEASMVKSSFVVSSMVRSQAGVNATFTYNIPDNYVCQYQDPAFGKVSADKQLKGKGNYSKNFKENGQETIYCVTKDGHWTTRTLDISVTAKAANISLSVVGLASNANGYLPVAPGTKLTVDYRATDSQWCEGLVTKAGNSVGTNVRFYSVKTEGATTTQYNDSKTTLGSGSFEVVVNEAMRLDFSCYGYDNKEVKQSINFSVK